LCALQADGTGGSVIYGTSNSQDIIEKITSGLSNLLFNIRPTVMLGCAANITFTPEVTTSVGVAKVKLECVGKKRKGVVTDTKGNVTDHQCTLNNGAFQLAAFQMT
jgi:hypothetical protein